MYKNNTDVNFFQAFSKFREFISSYTVHEIRANMQMKFAKQSKTVHNESSSLLTGPVGELSVRSTGNKLRLYLGTPESKKFQDTPSPPPVYLWPFVLNQVLPIV